MGTSFIGKSVVQPGFGGGGGDVLIALPFDLDLALGAAGGAWIAETSAVAGDVANVHGSLRWRFFHRGDWHLAANVMVGVSYRSLQTSTTNLFIPASARLSATRSFGDSGWALNLGAEGAIQQSCAKSG